MNHDGAATAMIEMAHAARSRQACIDQVHWAALGDAGIQWTLLVQPPNHIRRTGIMSEPSNSR